MVAIRYFLGKLFDIRIACRTIRVPVWVMTRGQLECSEPSIQRQIQKRLRRQTIQSINGKSKRLDKRRPTRLVVETLLIRETPVLSLQTEMTTVPCIVRS